MTKPDSTAEPLTPSTEVTPEMEAFAAEHEAAIEAGRAAALGETEPEAPSA